MNASVIQVINFTRNQQKLGKLQRYSWKLLNSIPAMVLNEDNGQIK
jgi:hypothetical protein